MALPKPKSIFDEEHSVASTGATFAYPDAYRNVIGIAFPARKGGKHQVMMRGAIKCPDPNDEQDDDLMEDVMEDVIDDENDSVINKVTDFARSLKKWLETNTVFVEDGGVLYAHGDVPLRDLGPPRFEEVLEMDSGKRFEVTGGIQEKSVKVNRPLMQGDPLSHYHIYLQVNDRECYPVFMGKNWR